MFVVPVYFHFVFRWHIIPNFICNFIKINFFVDKCEVKSEIDAVASIVDSKGNQNVLLKQLLASSAHNPTSAVAAAAVATVNSSAAVQAPTRTTPSVSSRTEVCDWSLNFCL